MVLKPFYWVVLIIFALNKIDSIAPRKTISWQRNAKLLHFIFYYNKSISHYVIQFLCLISSIINFNYSI